VTEQYTQLTTNYRYCVILSLNRLMGAVIRGSGSVFQILTVRGTNEYIYALVDVTKVKSRWNEKLGNLNSVN